MAQTKWTLETMRAYCKEYYPGYSVLKIEHRQKPYQKELWALVQCGNKDHEPTWHRWKHFIVGFQCHACYKEERKPQLKWNKQTVYDFFKQHGYTMLNKDNYVNDKKTVYCYDANGFIVKVSLTNLMRVLRDDNNRKGFSIIKYNDYAVYNIKHFCELYRPDYEFASEQYYGVKELHQFKYIGDCLREGMNRVFECTVDEFINGYVKHPDLTISKYELRVKRFLEANDIGFEMQYSFQDCRDKFTLPFDFYLPFYNAVIEVMGKQHYEVVEYFGGIEQFEYRQRHDKIKKNYCILNNINFIEISYLDYEISNEILQKSLEDILSSREEEEECQEQ